MRVDFDCDICLIGSNAYLLSSELSTHLSGRYVEAKMLPLSVEEFLDFVAISFEDSAASVGSDGQLVLFDDVIERYLKYRVMSAIAPLDMPQQVHSLYFSGLYEAVVTRNVLNRERATGR